VTLVGDHQVGVGAGGEDGRLVGWFRHKNDRDLVATLEHRPDGRFVVRAKASDASRH
jgi:hypothetical protein